MEAPEAGARSAPARAASSSAEEPSSAGSPGFPSESGDSRPTDALATLDGSLDEAAFRARVDRALGSGEVARAGSRSAASGERGERFEADAVASEPRVSRISRTDRPVPDAAQVEQLVEREVPDGSLPPEQLAEARQEVRERLVEEQVLLDQLARESAGEGASEQEIRDRRNLAQTLLSGQDQETRDRVMQRAADQVNAQP